MQYKNLGNFYVTKHLMKLSKSSNEHKILPSNIYIYIYIHSSSVHTFDYAVQFNVYSTLQQA